MIFAGMYRNATDLKFYFDRQDLDHGLVPYFCAIHAQGSLTNVFQLLK